MKKFRIKYYSLASRKITGQPVRIALLSDLHGLVYGEKNKLLLSAFEENRPDLIIAAGDIATNYERSTYVSAADLLGKLAKLGPVYYAYGNHECRMRFSDSGQEFMDRYERTLEKRGVHLLRNENVRMSVRDSAFAVCGLELPLSFYRRGYCESLSDGFLRELAGEPAADCIQVLIAHNPRYGDVYFRWGADLILSGHYHGGIIRFDEHHGLISSQMGVFPPYCCGDFHRGEQHMYVSAGAGEHTIPVRIHNPREILMIDLKPCKTGDGKQI